MSIVIALGNCYFFIRRRSWDYPKFTLLFERKVNNIPGHNPKCATRVKPRNQKPRLDEMSLHCRFGVVSAVERLRRTLFAEWACCKKRKQRIDMIEPQFFFFFFKVDFSLVMSQCHLTWALLSLCSSLPWLSSLSFSVVSLFGFCWPRTCRLATAFSSLSRLRGLSDRALARLPIGIRCESAIIVGPRRNNTPRHLFSLA